MDYLDPVKKRRHRNRLYLGYALFAVAIGMATLLLIYIANGYYVDRSTGQVIQNGLVYVDSRPGGAKVTLNGVEQRGSTDARLVIPGGSYEIGLTREGYRPWTRSLRLEGGSLRRLTYARLIPEVLETKNALSWRANPLAVSQSIDKRWLVAAYKSSPLLLTLVDTESTSYKNNSLELPEDIVKDTAGIFEVVEWASDNKTFLGSFTTKDSVEYILVDRTDPKNAINLSDEFKDPMRVFEISLRDRSRSELFAFNGDQKTLYSASIADGLIPTAIVKEVQAYKTFESDWVLYITKSDEPGMVEARFKRGDKDILLKNITEDPDGDYLLQLAKLGNAPVMGISSLVENRAIIYNDPEKYLNDNEMATIPVATTVLRVSNPIDLRISVDSSVILAYGPKNFSSHEFEDDRSYNFEAGLPLDDKQQLRWLDGQHFLFSSDGVQVMMDFDGSNRYALASSDVSIGSFFSSDISEMYTFTRAVKETSKDPQTPARMRVTSLLAASDR